MSLLSLRETSKRLGVSVWTIRAHCKRGNIQTVRVGRRVLLSEEELERIRKNGLPSLAVTKQ